MKQRPGLMEWRALRGWINSELFGLSYRRYVWQLFRKTASHQLWGLLVEMFWFGAEFCIKIHRPMVEKTKSKPWNIVEAFQTGSTYKKNLKLSYLFPPRGIWLPLILLLIHDWKWWCCSSMSPLSIGTVPKRLNLSKNVNKTRTVQSQSPKVYDNLLSQYHRLYIEMDAAASYVIDCK